MNIFVHISLNMSLTCIPVSGTTGTFRIYIFKTLVNVANFLLEMQFTLLAKVTIFT